MRLGRIERGTRNLPFSRLPRPATVALWEQGEVEKKDLGGEEGKVAEITFLIQKAGEALKLQEDPS